DHAGLEVRVGVGLAEAGDYAVVGVRTDGYRRAGRCHIQVQFHRLASVIDAAQADPVGVGQQLAVAVPAGGPRHRAGAAVITDVEVARGHRHLRLGPRLHVFRRHVVVGVGAVFAGVAIE